MEETEPNEEVYGPQPGPQTKFLETEADICFYGGEAGGGKALALDTPVLTTDGFKSIGDIVVGDVVYDSDGNETIVLVAHEVLHDRNCMEVTFSDGSIFVCDEDHLWVTMTNKDRDHAMRRTASWRTERRKGRKKTGVGKRPDLALANSLRDIDLKEPPLPKARSTKEILRSQSVRGRTNHSIDLAKPFSGSKSPPIDPYLLGSWLGDGTRVTGVITTADFDTVLTLKERGHSLRKIPSSDYGYRVEGLTKNLKELDLLGVKKIPEEAVNWRYNDRLELIQGLMDTDGHASKSGKCEFTTTTPNLATGMQTLLASIGVKTSIRCGVARLNGKDCGPKYRLVFVSNVCVFKLPRKMDRQKTEGLRASTGRRYITEVKQVDSVPVRCLTVSATSGTFLIGGALVPTHNSYAVILDHLRWSNVPNYSGIIFRRTSPQLTGAGSLWGEMSSLYPKFGAELRGGNTLDATFPSGATVELRHLQREETKYDHQGKQYAVITFEEATHFLESQFWYLLSRNRTDSDMDAYVRATCNPDASSWVAKLVEWWIDPLTGYSIPERSGVIRWLARVEDKIEWSDTRQELIDRFPNISSDEMRPKSFTFIHATLDDNPAMLKGNPGYKANLSALSRVERERLMKGNWKIVDTDGGEWASDYFMDIWFDSIPEDEDVIMRVTSLDASKGKTEKSDYQALVSVAITEQGNCYVDADLLRIDVSGLAERMVDFMEELPPDSLVVETNSFQELLANEIERACHLRGLSIPVYGEENMKNKLVRIRRLSTQLARGRLKFRRGREGCVLLVNQMQQFPNATHDDGPDALEMAIRHADDQLDGVPDYYQARELQEQ